MQRLPKYHLLALLALALPAVGNAFAYKAPWGYFAALVIWPLIPGVLALLAWPLVRTVFSVGAERRVSWGLANVLTLGLFALLHWYVVRLHVLPFGRGAAVVVAALLGVGWVFPRRRLWWTELRAELPSWCTAQIVFVLALNLWAWQASWHATILSGEKYMDMAFLSTLLRQTTLPLIDPWAAGHATRYYYFGFYQLALLAKLTGLPAAFAYQWSVATVFALTLVGAWGLFALFMKRGLAIWAAIVLMLSTNLKGVVHLVTTGIAATPDQFWALSRIFPQGLFAEHPVWSFLWADLHPHVMDYPFLIAFLALTVLYWRRPAAPALLAASLCWGLMLVTSSWDALFGGLFWGLGMLLHLGRAPWRMQLLALPAPALAIALVFPFYRELRGGVPMTVGRYDIAGTMMGELWLQGWWWLLFALAFVAVALRRNAGWRTEQGRWALGSIGLGVVVTLATQFVYVIEPVNTLFKFGNSLFLLSGIGALLLLPQMPLASRGVGPLYHVGLVVAVVGGLASAPGAFGGHPPGVPRPSLDGTLYLQYAAPDHARVIAHVHEHVAGPATVLEAPSATYEREFARTSAFTGLNSYLGWAGSVFTRGLPRAAVEERGREIDQVYGARDPAAVHEWCIDRGVDYVVFGSAEASVYGPEAQEKFRQRPDLFAPLACFGRACLYGVTGAYEASYRR